MAFSTISAERKRIAFAHWRSRALGVVGAFVGGGLFHLIGKAGVTGFNLWSVFVSVIGAVVVLAIYHAVARPHAHA